MSELSRTSSVSQESLNVECRDVSRLKPKADVTGQPKVGAEDGGDHAAQACLDIDLIRNIDEQLFVLLQIMKWLRICVAEKVEPDYGQVIGC